MVRKTAIEIDLTSLMMMMMMHMPFGMISNQLRWMDRFACGISVESMDWIVNWAWSLSRVFRDIAVWILAAPFFFYCFIRNHIAYIHFRVEYDVLIDTRHRFRIRIIVQCNPLKWTKESNNKHNSHVRHRKHKNTQNRVTYKSVRDVLVCMIVIINKECWWDPIEDMSRRQEDDIKSNPNRSTHFQSTQNFIVC